MEIKAQISPSFREEKKKKKNLFLQNADSYSAEDWYKKQSSEEILHSYLDKIVIDEAQIFSLMKYASVKGKHK